MAKKIPNFYLVCVLFVIVLLVRLYFTFQTHSFDVEGSYFVLRQVESIQETFIPSYVDDLSFSGRTHVFPSLYYYILSFFSLFLGPIITLKVIPNIFAASLVFIMYLVVFEITKNKNVSLFSSFAAGFIPVFFVKTFNSASSLSFIIPLLLYLLYCFIRIKHTNYLYQFLILSFILALTSTISFVFILGLLIYLLLMKLEYKTQNKTELEVILFVTFLTFWFDILLYKKAFLIHSYSVIWQNLPSQILAQYFTDIDIVLSVTKVGLIPLILGIFAVYRYMFKERNKLTYLLIAFALSVSFLLWFKLITFDVGLVFLSVILLPLAAQTLNSIFNYAEKTKFTFYIPFVWLGLIVFFALTSIIPTISQANNALDKSLTFDELNALLWLKEFSEPESVVLSTISEGNLVSAIAKRKNVADSDFILVRNSDDIYSDIENMYTAFFKTSALENLEKYHVNYIYFSNRAKDEFGIDEIKYVEPDCFELVHESSVQIYKVKCHVII